MLLNCHPGRLEDGEADRARGGVLGRLDADALVEGLDVHLHALPGGEPLGALVAVEVERLPGWQLNRLRPLFGTLFGLLLGPLFGATFRATFWGHFSGHIWGHFSGHFLP